MNLDDLNAMKFDRRLRFRRGWVSENEMEAYLDSLPDVASKAGEPEPAPSAAAGPAPSAAPIPAPAEASPEPPGVAAFGALPDEPTPGS